MLILKVYAEHGCTSGLVACFEHLCCILRQLIRNSEEVGLEWRSVMEVILEDLVLTGFQAVGFVRSVT